MSESGNRRGRAHDAEGARQTILDAAEKVFAEHGFDGARVDVIAAEAGYNKSLIFQYFDDKLGLYAEVIRRADDQTREWQNEALNALQNIDAVLDPDQVRNLLRTYLGKYFDYLVEHPNVLRIQNWELAEGWQIFSKIVSQRDFEDVDQFTLVLPKLQKAGLLRSDLNPLLQLTPAIFMCHVYLSILPLYQVFLPGSDLTAPEGLARGKEFIIDFIINGLLATPSQPKPKPRKR